MPELAPGLYLAATPIGNLGDITLRVLDALQAADLILCEDSRITGRLLTRYGISRRVLAYNEHTGPRLRPRLLARLAEGQRLVLVSDAGTPLVSDPGYKLVREALEQGNPVFSLPGASSVLAALSVAGLPTDRFLFAGFLPPKTAARRRDLGDLARVPATLVILEAPHRLPEALSDMAMVLGPRQAAVARELTKLHEEVRRGGLDALAAHYAEAGPPKGEVVVVVAPPEPAAARPEDLDGQLRAALRTMPLKEAAAAVAAATGASRREVYSRALALRAAAADEPPE